MLAMRRMAISNSVWPTDVTFLRESAVDLPPFCSRRTPEAYAADIASEEAKWGAIIKQTGVTAQ
jgi:hypothetical protein